MLQDQIAARIDAFVNELFSLVRKEALAAVAIALGEASAVGSAQASREAAPRRRRGRPRKASAVAKPAPAANGAAKPTAAAGAKPVATIDATDEAAAPGGLDVAVLAFVKANPGSGVEQMVKGLRAPTEKVKASVAGLVEAKGIKKTGKTRGTRYFPV